MLDRSFHAVDSCTGKQQWIKTRLTGPGAIYNAGNFLALGSGIVLNLGEVGDHPSFGHALSNHLMGSPEAVWLTTAMILFIVSGEIYHRAYQPRAKATLVGWGDLISGLAAIALTVALVMLGDTAAALLAGFMLTFGKLGSAVLALVSGRHAPRADRALRLTVVASRAPSILSLGLAVVPAIHGSVPTEAAVLPLIMIICFSFWLWADLLLIKRP